MAPSPTTIFITWSDELPSQATTTPNEQLSSIDTIDLLEDENEGFRVMGIRVGLRRVTPDSGGEMTFYDRREFPARLGWPLFPSGEIRARCRELADLFEDRDYVLNRRLNIENRIIRLEFENSDRPEAFVRADRDRLRQIIGQEDFLPSSIDTDEDL